MMCGPLSGRRASVTRKIPNHHGRVDQRQGTNDDKHRERNDKTTNQFPTRPTNPRINARRPKAHKTEQRKKQRDAPEAPSAHKGQRPAIYTGTQDNIKKRKREKQNNNNNHPLHHALIGPHHHQGDPHHRHDEQGGCSRKCN